MFHEVLIVLFGPKPVQMWHMLNFNISTVIDHIKFSTVALSICKKIWNKV